MTGVCSDRSIRRSVVFVVAAMALFLGATAASGQMELAVITGIVTDEAGVPLEGVTLRLRDVERGREIVFQSGKDGRFYRRGLQAIEYSFVVEKKGYQPIENKLKLAAGMDRRFNFKLVMAAPEGAEEFVRGIAAFNSGDNEGAVLAFEEAAKKAPDAPEIQVNLALAYLRLGRPDEAIARLEKVASQLPDARTLFQLGGAYVEAKQYDKAIEVIEKGLVKQPSLADPLALEATVTLGAVYFATGKIELAVANFEKALAVNPTAAAPKLGLGKCAFSKGDVDQALRYFKEVVSSAPGTPEAAEADTFIKELEKVKAPGE